MAVMANAENLRQYKSRFSLIAELILAFDSIPNMVREVKNLPPNFKRIPLRIFYLSKYFHLDS